MHSTNKASTREKKNIMSSNGMGSRLALVIVCSVLFLLIGTSAATGKTGRITVYWGQTSNEGSLRKACESKLYSTVILSFLNNFGSGKYGLNLAGHSWAAVGPDFTYCQSKKVLVLLAIGGGIGKYSLASKADAKAVAKAIAKTGPAAAWRPAAAAGRRGEGAGWPGRRLPSARQRGISSNMPQACVRGGRHELTAAVVARARAPPGEARGG
jgi:hypothetical protein